MKYQVSRWVLDTRSGRLYGPDGEVHLRPQTFRLFRVLVEHAHELLSVDELIDLAWDVNHVSVGTFRQAVSELRQALGDSASTPQIIATVPRRGYRLIVPVEPVSSSESRDELSAEPPNEDDAPEPASPSDGTPHDGLPGASGRHEPVHLKSDSAFIGICTLLVVLGVAVGLKMRSESPDDFELSRQSSRLYRQALDHMDHFDLEAARRTLETADAAGPDHPLILDRLSSVYDQLGLDSLAAETARRAALSAVDAPWETARSAAARDAETRGAWSEAAELLQALWQRHPDQLDYGLRLARAWTESGRTDAALDLITRLRQRSGPHPNLDLLELDVLAALNEIEPATVIARRLASTRDATVSIAARLRLLTLLLRRGTTAEAEALIDELEADADQATGRQRAELARCRAFLSERQGAVDETRTLYRQAETLFQVHGDRDGLASLLNRQALFLMQIGELDAARRALTRGIQAARRHGLQRRLVVALCLLAQVAAEGPDPGQAWEPLREAQALVRGSQEPRRQILWHRTRGDVFLATGDTDGADREYSRCLALATDIRAGAGAAYCRLGLSAVALELGDGDVAYRYARSATEDFERLGRVPDLLAARFQVAAVETARGRPRAAQAELITVAEQATALSLDAFKARADAALDQLDDL